VGRGPRQTARAGGEAHQGLGPADREAILKTLGSQLGGEAVDAVLDDFNEPPTLPRSRDDLDLPALKKFCEKLRTRVRVLLLTTPASAADPATWLQLGERFAAARGERTRGDGQEGGRASAQALLDVVAALSEGERANEAAASVA
jgi:hypothetical protein